MKITPSTVLHFCCIEMYGKGDLSIDDPPCGILYCTFETVRDRGRQTNRDKDRLYKLIKKSIPGITGFGEGAVSVACLM